MSPFRTIASFSLLFLSGCNTGEAPSASETDELSIAERLEEPFNPFAPPPGKEIAGEFLPEPQEQMVDEPF